MSPLWSPGYVRLSARQRLLHPGHGLDVTVKSLTSYRIPTVPRSDLRFFLPLKTRRIADSSAEVRLGHKVASRSNRETEIIMTYASRSASFSGRTGAAAVNKCVPVF